MGASPSCASSEASVNPHSRRYISYPTSEEEEELDVLLDEVVKQVRKSYHSQPNSDLSSESSQIRILKNNQPSTNRLNLKIDTSNTTIDHSCDNATPLPRIISSEPLIMSTTPIPLNPAALNQLLESRTLTSTSTTPVATPIFMHRRTNSGGSEMSNLSFECVYGANDIDCIETDNDDDDSCDKETTPVYRRHRSRSVGASLSYIDGSGQKRNRRQSVPLTVPLSSAYRRSRRRHSVTPTPAMTNPIHHRRHSNILRCDTMGDWSVDDLTDLESQIETQLKFLSLKAMIANNQRSVASNQ